MARYLGMEDLSVWVPDEYESADYLRLVAWADERGVQIGPCSNLSNHEAVVLGLPDRYGVIEQFQNLLLLYRARRQPFHKRLPHQKEQ